MTTTGTPSRCPAQAATTPAGIGPHRVHDIEGPVTTKRADERQILTRKATRPAQVVHDGTEERVAARAVVVAKDVDGNVVIASEPIDERQQGGNDPLGAAPIDAARDHQGDAHGEYS